MIDCNYLAEFSSLQRTIGCRVKVFNPNYTVKYTWLQSDRIVSIDIERVGTEKFFGTGICQKATLTILDKDAEVSVSNTNKFQVCFKLNNHSYKDSFPMFYVDSVTRDENTNELKIIGYDALYFANKTTYAELKEVIVFPTTIEDLMNEAAALIGCGFDTNIDVDIDDNALRGRTYTTLNYEDSDTLATVIADAANACTCDYFVNDNDDICFKREGWYDAIDNLVIDTTDFYEFSSEESVAISDIVSVTELGDNVSAVASSADYPAFVRNNGFWENREDIDNIVLEAYNTIADMSFDQGTLDWRGNFLLEPFDILAAKDKNMITHYICVKNDVISYNGGMSQTTRFIYEDKEDIESNPSSLGETLKKTFARVDKTNKEITLVAAETTELQLNQNEIATSVSNLDEQVRAKITSTDVSVMIESALETDVEKVTTSTGYKFDQNGLNISKSDSEISTTITENGMKIKKLEEEVLVVNNQGVKAEDLHAITYLIIGDNSRLEDYDDDRTGCFWLGQ